MTVTTFQDEDILKFWDDILSGDTYRLKLAEIQDNYQDKKSLYVPYTDIDYYNSDFAIYLLNKPDRCIRLGEKAIRSRLPATWDPANDINLRIDTLPKDAHVEVRELRSKHLNRLVAVDGLVRKATLPKLKMTNALYRCAKCNAEIWTPQKGMYATEPLMCPNEGCNKSALRFILDEEASVFSDTQKIEIQENPEGLRGGAQPERMSGYIEDDISGKVTPGNRVTLNGIIRPVEKSDRDKSTVFDTYMEIISVEFSQEEYDEIEITDEDEERILEMARDPEFFNNLVKSIAPSIFGLEEVKQAVALQLFGGTHKEMDDGTTTRGDIHILMMGDPGVAKSQILSYMSRLAPRGIYASGKSASAAGLCVGADTILINDKGERSTIGDYVNARMDAPEEYRPGIWRQTVDDWSIQSIGDLGSVRYLPIEYIWRIKTPERLYRISAGGMSLILTAETKIQAMRGPTFDWVAASELNVGDMASMVMENMRFFPITEIEILTEDLPEYVYDLTVTPSHAFVGNGFVIHNTAAAVKDDFGDGRWTLEAGALVLADKGLACIDELDKMTPQDRSSLHEAMESQRISIAKAGITATLQSRCSLLAAANPKYGRFDMTEKIVGQIDLPPALMSRFDLIFVLTDKPREEYDKKLSTFVLKGHRRGQARAMKEEEVGGVNKEAVLKDTEDHKPIYDMEIIRKYVSYAKQICFPIMTDEAMELIEGEYLSIRKTGEGDNASVPITARQLEAYVRLSEASAKTRLSPIVDERDVTRAINLVKYYMDGVAKTDDGSWDFDRMGSSFSKRDRDTKRGLYDQILKALDDAGDSGLSRDDIIIMFNKESMFDIDHVIEEMHDNNFIIESKGRWMRV